jgi:metal-responsive CopG/Arc/MetJ family transcriptional regulator
MMARPKLEANRKKARFTITVDPDILERLDTLTARKQARLPYGKIDRSEVVSDLLRRGLEADEQALDRRPSRKGSSDAA